VFQRQYTTNLGVAEFAITFHRGQLIAPTLPKLEQGFVARGHIAKTKSPSQTVMNNFLSFDRSLVIPIARVVVVVWLASGSLLAKPNNFATFA
jgi:hypothetical protein